VNLDILSQGRLTVKFPCPGGTILIDKVMVCLLDVVIIDGKDKKRANNLRRQYFGATVEHLHYSPIRLSCARVGDPLEYLEYTVIFKF